MRCIGPAGVETTLEWKQKRKLVQTRNLNKWKTPSTRKTWREIIDLLALTLAGPQASTRRPSCTTSQEPTIYH